MKFFIFAFFLGLVVFSPLFSFPLSEEDLLSLHVQEASLGFVFRQTERWETLTFFFPPFQRGCFADLFPDFGFLSFLGTFK